MTGLTSSYPVHVPTQVPGLKDNFSEQTVVLMPAHSTAVTALLASLEASQAPGSAWALQSYARSCRLIAGRVSSSDKFLLKPCGNSTVTVKSFKKVAFMCQGRKRALVTRDQELGLQ